ncbi:PEP-CTERM sorting domain-containing protein [Massilia niastensis]|uniref:PEP-CTERM sorting domain-containing protein n=1 Tax=Massilia niastensis TaxID=544911 RepID=UPI00035CDB87|nr:PEP-CTERM sorting domain-containing protein [Massilia niastensis]
MRSKLALLAASLCVATTCQASLLINGGAETGTLAGWTIGGESNPRIDDGSFDPGIDPHSGDFMFLGHRGAFGTLTQNVALAGAGSARQLRVSFWEQGLNQGKPSDNGYVSLTYRASDGSVIGTALTSVIDAHRGVWKQYEGFFDVPLSAFSVDYTMHFVRHFGRDLDAFFDDNELDLVGQAPEPGTLATLSLGALAMAMMRRRRHAGAAR